MEGSIFRFVWLFLAVPGANLIPVTKDDEIEKQDDGTPKEKASSEDKVNDDSDTNPDSEPDIDNGIAVKRALTTGNDEPTTNKTSVPLQQHKRNDTQIYRHSFGSPGPPYSYFFDDINKFKNGTIDQMNSNSDLHLQTGDPFVMADASKSQKSMQNISIPYQHRVPSLSTLSQDDMTMDAVMGRPPRLTEAGMRLQREQEERQRARQQTLREFNGGKSQVQMKKEDTFLLSAPAPREMSKQPISFSEPIDECVTEKQRPVHMEYKPKLKKEKSENDAEMMKFIKDLARSVKQPEPYVKYFDAAVVYDKHDYEEVKEFIDELKLIAAAELKQELRIELFDSEEFAQSMVMVISDVTDRCSVVFVYLTENSNTDLITLFCDEAVGLSRLGLNDPGVVPGRHGPGRQWMLKPVHTQPLKCRQYPTPVGLLTLIGLDWYDWPSLFVRDRAKSILLSAIANRKSKEATQNISNKYDSVLGSKPREAEKNELLWTKSGSRDSTTSMDALSVYSAHSLKSSVSAQNGENNTHYLARRNTTGGLSCPVDPQQINRQTDRLSYFQKPLIQQRTQSQQFQHQIPNRTMPNSGAPAINNVQGQPRMQLFTPSPQVPRHENPVYSPRPQMHPASATTLHPSSLYEDQLSYQYQNTTPSSRPPSLTVFPKLGANREVGIQHHIFEQNLHENENPRQQTRLTGEQNIQQGNYFDSLVGEPYHLPNREAEQNRLQNIPGGKSQHRLTDEHNQVTKREAWQQLNSFERDLYSDQTRLNGESNETNVPQQDRFTNGQRIPRVHLQNRPTGEHSLQGSDEHFYQQQTRLDDKPNVTNAPGQDRFTGLPRVYLQNRHIGEHSQEGVGHFNSAEYGSLMLDPRHDTPPSSQLTVVSRLTGRLITNPDLSNSDLEIDGDRNPNTLPHVNGDVDSVEGDASDSSDDGDDDDVAISDDSDCEDSLKEIFLKKGKVLNIIGSSVVQLGRDNVSFEQYVTKHKHHTKRHDSKCKTVKGKDDEGLPQTLSRVKDCSPTLQANRKQNTGVSDDGCGNKRLSLTKPAKSNQRTQASDDGYRDKGDSPILLVKSDRMTRTSDGDHRDKETSLIKPIIKSEQRTQTSDEDRTLTAREAQQLARDIVDMQPSYLYENIDVNSPYLDHTSNNAVGRQPEASKSLNNVDAVRKTSDIRDTNRKLKETGVPTDQGEVINDLDRYESLEDNSSYFDGSSQNTRTSRNPFLNHHDKPTSDLPAQFAFSSFRTSIFTKLTGFADGEQLGAEVCDLETDLD